MKIPRRLRRVNFHSAAHHMTSFAGLRFVFDLAHKLGLTQDLRTLTVKKRRRGIPIEDFVLGLASNFLIGGDSLSDLQVLRDETVTRELCYGLEVPAPTTAGERLRTFALGHIYQLERIQRRAAGTILTRVGGSGPLTVDVDSSIFEVHGYLKEGARYSWVYVGLNRILSNACRPRRPTDGGFLQATRAPGRIVRGILNEICDQHDAQKDHRAPTPAP